MSVIKPRNRLINFRLTEEEFDYLHRACHEQGARSISDFARGAVLQQAGTAAAPAGAPDASRLERLILQLDGRVTDLITALRPASATTPPPGA